MADEFGPFYSRGWGRSPSPTHKTTLELDLAAVAASLWCYRWRAYCDVGVLYWTDRCRPMVARCRVVEVPRE